jgi:hypothetical protein
MDHPIPCAAEIVLADLKVNATDLGHDIIMVSEHGPQLIGDATGQPFGWA